MERAMENTVPQRIGGQAHPACYVLCSLSRGTAAGPCPLSGLDGFAVLSLTLSQAESDFKRFYRSNWWSTEKAPPPPARPPTVQFQGPRNTP